MDKQAARQSGGYQQQAHQQQAQGASSSGADLSPQSGCTAAGVTLHGQHNIHSALTIPVTD